MSCCLGLFLIRVFNPPDTLNSTVRLNLVLASQVYSLKEDKPEKNEKFANGNRNSVNCSWNVWRQFVAFCQEGAHSGPSPYRGMFFAINYTCPLPGASASPLHLLLLRNRGTGNLFCFFSRLAVSCILPHDILMKGIWSAQSWTAVCLLASASDLFCQQAPYPWISKEISTCKCSPAEWRANECFQNIVRSMDVKCCMTSSRPCLSTGLWDSAHDSDSLYRVHWAPFFSLQVSAVYSGSQQLEIVLAWAGPCRITWSYPCDVQPQVNIPFLSQEFKDFILRLQLA